MHNSTIEQSELWEISRRLVAFNTVSSESNLAAAEYLANYLEQSGFTVRLLSEDVAGVQKANVLAWAGPEEPGGLIISGHIDVVPFDGQPGWKTDPLVMQMDGERIVGRGVTDMKVFLAQAILAGKHHPLTTLKKPLVYLFTCDEEIAGQGSSRLVKHLPKVFEHYPLPTRALIGEPTNFEIYPAHKGYAMFNIRVDGKGGHSSMPHAGLNAIEKMSDVIQLIKETGRDLQTHITAENKQLFPESPYSTLNLAIINGGLAANMIADTCKLTVSIRVAPGDDAGKIIQELQQRVDQEISSPMQQFSADCGVYFEGLVSTPPLELAIDDPFCKLLAEVIGQPVERGASYATDGGQFQTIGIDSYICGPGLLAEAHQPNESIPVANFLSGQAKVEQIIQRWCL